MAVADAEQQSTGMEEQKRPPSKHVKEEREKVVDMSTLPFRSL